jgi:hypothetical protein
LNDIVGPADRVNGLRLTDIVKNSGDIAITINFESVDLQQDIAGLNSGKFCGPVAGNRLSLNCSLVSLDP